MQRRGAAVTEHALGAPEPAQHCHIECLCEGLAHRTEHYIQGCFCRPCASAKAVELGMDANDVEVEAPNEDGDDGVRWCGSCGALITSKITADAANEEMAHWEASGSPGGPPKTSAEWREFLLCVEAIEERHLVRVADVLAAHGVAG
jgi:hypothetical protein